VPVNITAVKANGGAASGISVVWDDGQFVVISAPKGLVACGAIDVEVMDKADLAVAVSEGTIEHPLVTPDDLLKAEIMRITARARELGIEIGMSGEEALEKLF
jgi:uncharacterized protein YunC (DUF1805 family)